MRWPSHPEVHTAIGQWVEHLADTMPTNVVAAGYFGSYARGNAGVGSDLDIVVIVTESNLPFERRSNAWDFSSIPVPVEAHVYTTHEWQQLPERQPRFYRTPMQEMRWLKRNAEGCGRIT